MGVVHHEESPLFEDRAVRQRNQQQQLQLLLLRVLLLRMYLHRELMALFAAHGAVLDYCCRCCGLFGSANTPPMHDHDLFACIILLHVST